jgi:hypothetical protein
LTNLLLSRIILYPLDHAYSFKGGEKLMILTNRLLEFILGWLSEPLRG